MLRRWAVRFYWLGAGAVAIQTIHPPELRTSQLAWLALAGFLCAFVLRRALAPSSFTRTLRQALFGS
jgi:hypothetical protein